MSQQTPPNTPDDPGRDYDDGRTPSFAQDRATEQDNPYFGRQQAAPPPDLDAASPTLTAAETRRMNRKALMFLGGILALLFILGYFVLRGGDDEETTAAPEREAAVVVPTLPTAPDLEPTEPIAMEPVEEQVIVPPLPMAEPSYAGPSNNSGGGYVDTGPRPPTLRERRMGGNQAPVGADAGPATGAPSATSGMQAQQMAMMQAALGLPPGAATPTAIATSAQYITNPDALLVRGTFLRCVLETRIVTDVPGFTSCVLTEPVYSINGRRLLLPKGSKILGQYEQKDDLARVPVVWDRIITPNGVDVSMSSPGVDQLGGAGVPGDYNAHWGSKIMSALLISLIADAFSYAAAENGPETTVIGPGGVTVQQPFQSATARSMERLANQALQKSANRRATVTINQGNVVNVYVAQDVDFSGVLALMR